MQCIFCGSKGPMSKEHAIPRWARKAIGATGRVTMSRRDTGETLRVYTGLSVVLRKSVCQACNGGWMKRLEDTVAPWLTPALVGDLTALALPQQATVAFWIAKTGLIIELALRATRQPMYVPDSNLKWLYEHRDSREPPPGTFGWMARVNPSNADPAFGKYTSSFVAGGQLAYGDPNPGEPGPPLVNYFSTFTIGCAVFQVFGQDFRAADHLAQSGRPLSVMVPPVSVQPYVVKVWPSPEPVMTWPPGPALSTDELGEFAGWYSLVDRFEVVERRGGKVAWVVLAEDAKQARQAL